MLDSLHDLDASFKARGSRLIIVHGNPPDIVPKLIQVSWLTTTSRDTPQLCHPSQGRVCLQAWKIGKVCFEADTEPYSVARDRNMIAGIEAAGVPWHSFVSHTLYVSTPTLKHVPASLIVPSVNINTCATLAPCYLLLGYVASLIR